MEDVERLCQRVIIINRGKIVYNGDLKKLVDRYVNHKIIKPSFTKPVAKSDLEKFGKIREYLPQRAIIEVPKDQVKEKAAVILSELPVDDILIDEIEIEEVIRKFFAEN